MFVGIAYGKGVVMCKQWDPEVRWLGVNYRKFVRRTFPEALKCSANPKKKLVLQDGCPVMNSKQGKLGYKSVGCEVFSIPARSPDLNPIENIFNLVRRDLAEFAKQNELKNESYEDFAVRVKETLLAVDTDLIDRTIKSLPNRLDMVIRGKGLRTKY